MRRLNTILFILSILGILVYWLMPERYFKDVVYPLQDSMLLTAYDDRADGGLSTANLSLADSALLFSCTLHTGNSPAWCGMLWHFTPDSLLHYRNWMLVDSLVFDVDIQGTKEFLVKVWTYDPDVTDPENKFSFRPLIKEVVVSEYGRQRIVVPVSQLYVPDYWFENQKVDKSLELKHLEGAARLEIAPGWNVKRGKPFSLKVYGIEGKGVSSVPLGLLLFFFLAIATLAVGVRHKKKERENNEKS
jgi:hypothetical protein